MANGLWNRVAQWFAGRAQHVTIAFLPEPGAASMHAYEGYLRLWLSEGHLATGRSWGNDHFPVLHGGASLRFLGGGSTPFTTFTRPPDAWRVPGAQLDFQITPLLPFSGGTVEIEAALYRTSAAGPLATAVEVIGGLAKLMGPPLATAASISEKVSDGLATVLNATGDQPVLGLHWSMVSAGGLGNTLQSGHLVVVNAPEPPGTLLIKDGLLAVDDGAGPRRLDGADYLVLRVECRTERDDWRFPELDRLLREAARAHLEGLNDTYRARRVEAISQAWASADLTPSDRIRVAKLVAEELDRVRELGAVPGPERSLETVAAERLPARDAAELRDVTLDDLLR